VSELAAGWRVEVALPLAGVATVYLIGWTRLALRSPVRCRGRLIGRLALALAGLTALAVALLALHDAAHESFAAHMAQHLLLIAVAVPTLLLADPLPAGLWSLPASARRVARNLLAPRAPLRRAGCALTRLPVAWTLHAAAVWLWHVPVAYDAALASGLLHDAEHLVFVGTAALFWWPVIDPAPRLTATPLGWRIVYLVLGAFQSAALGVVLVAAPRPLYAYGAIDDQALGGVLMWGVGGAVDMAAVLVLVHRFLTAGERGTRLPSLTASGGQGTMSRFDT
jgi:putative membrane protein